MNLEELLDKFSPTITRRSTFTEEDLKEEILIELKDETIHSVDDVFFLSGHTGIVFRIGEKK